MSLYTKYRPRDWDSVIGQDAISHILRASLIQNRVGHAYILTGSRGTGKTTTARILAKGVNCLHLRDGNPCHECLNCKAFDQGSMLDVIEIDGASNNGVENVRDLIEKARFEPNQGKYKVYIIDEVHMLSTGAFNALLKTLEEPPSHVKFILATTEIDKVPETIRSRSLRFDFKKIEIPDIIQRLEYVTQQEGIEAESEALALIARAARGALRDALTLTEQHIVNNAISTEYVRSTLSLIEDTLIDEIINAMSIGDTNQMHTIIKTLSTRHIEVRGLFDQILYALRDLMVTSFLRKDSQSFESTSYMIHVFEDAYGKIRTIIDSALIIEITLMRATLRTHTPGTPGVEKELSQTEKKQVQKQPLTNKETSQIQENQGTLTSKPVEEIKEQEIQNDAKNEDGIQFSYIRVLEEIKKEKSAIMTDLKTARFELGEKKVTFLFSGEWHYNRVNTAIVKNMISDILSRLYGGTWTIECKMGSTPLGLHVVDEVF